MEFDINSTCFANITNWLTFNTSSFSTKFVFPYSLFRSLNRPMYESPGQPWVLGSTLWIPDCVAEKGSVFSVREALFVSFSFNRFNAKCGQRNISTKFANVIL